MSEDTTYEYAEGNLLEEPNTYEYTTVHGPAFFEAYREQRQRVRRANLDRLDEALANHEEASINLLAWLHESEPELVSEELGQRLPDVDDETPTEPRLTEADRGEVVDTRIVLEQLLAALVDPETGPKNGHLETWTDALVNRFEVTKRLASRYEITELAEAVDGAPPRRLAETGERIEEPGVYALAALAFVLVHRRSDYGKLPALNAALKLLDTATSLDIEPGTPGVVLAVAAIDAELATTRRLADEQGVQP